MKEISSKAGLLLQLREKQGSPVSGTVLAKELGISRVAVWKTVQALLEAGYSIETKDTGYLLDPKNEKDFLYPWEFMQRDFLFFHHKNTGSTMDRARELALRGIDSAVVSADRQSSGKGRSGRTWISRQGGLFFTFLERPRLAVADYNLHSIIMQIALVRTVSSVCGKQAYLRWPNDVYINKRKIAGVITEISGEGDLIKWISLGVGLNINNHIPSGKAASCAEITGRNLSRRDILISLLEEAEKIKKTFSTSAVYSQGSHALANEWNSLSDCLGAKAVVFEPNDATQTGNASVHKSKPEKILARGIFEGIDPIGRCILKTKDGKLFFNQGSVSLAFLNPD